MLVATGGFEIAIIASGAFAMIGVLLFLFFHQAPWWLGASMLTLGVIAMLVIAAWLK